jgi:hypothetical protein
MCYMGIEVIYVCTHRGIEVMYICAIDSTYIHHLYSHIAHIYITSISL